MATQEQETQAGHHASMQQHQGEHLEERGYERPVLQRDRSPFVQGPGWSLEEFRILRPGGP